MDENAFRWACYSGNLRVALWLLYVKPERDISFATPDMQSKIYTFFLLYCFAHKNISLLML